MLPADRSGREVDDLTRCRLSAFTGYAKLVGELRHPLDLDSPAGSRHRVDCVCGEADNGVVYGPVVEAVLAQTDREFFAIEGVLDRQDHR